MIRIVVAGVVGGIVLFVWGMASHVMLGWHTGSFKGFKNEDAVMESLREYLDGDGMYMLPNGHANLDPDLDPEKKAAAVKEAMKKMEEGPLVFASVRESGMRFSLWTTFGVQLATAIVSAALMAWILLRGRVSGYLTRVVVTVAVALLAILICKVPDWTWWGFTDRILLVHLADTLIGWTLAGLVIAAIAIPLRRDAADDA